MANEHQIAKRRECLRGYMIPGVYDFTLVCPLFLVIMPLSLALPPSSPLRVHPQTLRSEITVCKTIAAVQNSALFPMARGFSASAARDK